MVQSYLDLLHRAPKVCSTDSQLLMLERYDTSFGVFNHRATVESVPGTVDRPLALVAMHPSEDPITGSLLHERLKVFIELDIAKYVNISFPDFLDQPTYLCDLQIELCNEKQRKESEAIDRGLQNMPKVN